jgi:poly-gamma-glutamate synthesis protein (capsule biosynthesis protein)
LKSRPDEWDKVGAGFFLLEAVVLYDAERGDISIAIVGDAMLSRRLEPFREPQFLALADLLRNADCTIANLEFLFHDYESSWLWTGGTYTRSDPRNLLDLKWLGVDVVSTANNHSFDFSEGGFLTTLRHLDAAGIPHAGGGADLDHARAPAYFDSACGRVAVMSASSTYTDVSRAGEGRPDFPGKPGINVLRHKREMRVPRDVLRALERASEGLGYAESSRAERRFMAEPPLPPRKRNDPLDFLGAQFRPGSDFGVSTSVNPEDRDGIARWIRGAREQAEWVVYGLHCHESGITGDFHGSARESLPDFLVEFAHWSIDQGCHVFAGHGPHFLRGIEIYNGAPIFYSLGNFIFQNETVDWVPSEGYKRFNVSNDLTPGEYMAARSDGGKRAFPVDPVFWRSVVAVCEFRAHELREIKLYPIDLGFGRPVPMRGRPLLAQGEVAQQTLEWLQAASAPFGTEIEIQGDMGTIRL